MTKCEYLDDYYYCYNPQLVDPSGQDPLKIKWIVNLFMTDVECNNRQDCVYKGESELYDPTTECVCL